MCGGKVILFHRYCEIFINEKISFPVNTMLVIKFSLFIRNSAVDLKEEHNRII